MPISLLLAVLVLLTVVGFYMGRGRVTDMAQREGVGLHSLTSYYGLYVALWCGLPALLLVLVWVSVETTVIRAIVVDSLPPELLSLPRDRLSLVVSEIRNLAAGQGTVSDPAIRVAADRFRSLQVLADGALVVVALSLAIAGLVLARGVIAPSMQARIRVEKALQAILIVSSTIAILTTVGIVLSLLFEAIRFFARVPPTEFLFGLRWSPQTAIRADQIGSSGAFGAVPLFTGTLLITVIAMCVAVPIGLMSAIYLADYAPKRVRDVAKPMLEILAGIPTVVYGFFAALTVAPFIRDLGPTLGLTIASESALAAGLVMGIMIIPFVSSLSDDVINAVPQSLRDGSAALGATKSETITNVVLPAALPGIVAAVMLAISKAIGETMIVVMAAGLAANLTANPLSAVTTVTVQIATLLVGDQEFDSPKTLSAFALGLVLFWVTLALNIIALRVVQRYREKYD